MLLGIIYSVARYYIYSVARYYIYSVARYYIYSDARYYIYLVLLSIIYLVLLGIIYIVLLFVYSLNVSTCFFVCFGRYIFPTTLRSLKNTLPSQKLTGVLTWCLWFVNALMLL